MPAPGFQHQSVSNPFEEPKPRISQYTADEIALLQHRLEQKLGPEYISSRPGPSGVPVHYIGAEKVISLANDVFGFNGWSSSIQNIQVDFVDEHPTTHRMALGISVVVRVTLRDGTYHEDIGYGQIENAKTKGAAFEKAKKEATTDAMKRALRHFGNVLGNCIYDKEYVKKVAKIKVEPRKQWELADLHRHADFKEYGGGQPQQQQNQPQPQQQPPQMQQNQQPQPQQQNQQHQNQLQQQQRPAPPAANGNANGNTSTDKAPANGFKQEKVDPPQSAAEAFDDFLGSIDDFDEADFNVPEEHPDGVVIATAPEKPIADVPKGGSSNQNAQWNNPYSTPTTPVARPAQNQYLPAAPMNPPAAQYKPANVPEQVGFLSARGIKNTTEGSAISGAPVFNPRAESPSIRKTVGIDHSSSKPIARGGVHVPPQQTSTPSSTTNTSSGPGPGYIPGGINADGSRRIGAPGGTPSPLSNRGQYRPPTMKRPLPEGGRTALAEVSTNGGEGVGGGVSTAGPAVDPKRQRMA